MRRLAALPAVALLALGILPVAASAQESDGSAGLTIDSAEVVDSGTVIASVSVPSTGGGQLPPEAFTVFEDGEAQTATVTYAASDDLQILLLLDTTGSMGGAPLTGAKQAANNFIGQLPDGTAVAVMSFDAQPQLLTDFTASEDEHLAAIDGLVADGRTAMYDAVLAAVKAFPEAANETKRVVVLLADGEDNESASVPEAAIDALTGAGVILHSVEYLTAFTDEDAIRQMASTTGGSVLEAANADELVAVYEQLAADLVSRYSIEYTSSSHGSVELAVTTDHDGVMATGTRTIELPPEAPTPAPSEEPVVTQEPVTPPATQPPPTVQVEVSAVARTALIVGAVLWFIALVIFVLAWIWPREQRSQLWGMATRAAGKKGALSDIANRASLVAEHALERRGYQSALNRALERAAINLRPGEFVVLMLSGAFTGFAVGYLLSGLLAGFAMTTVTLIGFRLVVMYRGDRRQARFGDQLPETLQLLSGSLKAGYSLMQAIDAVAREADSPSAEEFSRLVIETRLGRDSSDALRAMAERVRSEDFEWVVQAIEIHRDVGGDLAEVLETVAGTIRERNEVRRQIRALSAEGRLSAYVLLALPFAISLIMFVTNREYISQLFTSGLLGWAMIAAAAVLMLVGTVWVRKLVKLVF